MPKITAIETIDEPPRLKSGKGKPVTGIIPTTVDICHVNHKVTPDPIK